MGLPVTDLVLNAIRLRLEKYCWGEATSASGEAGPAGQCTVTSMLLKEIWADSEYRSTVIDGVSHWFLRVHTSDGTLDVDLTGDQFGLDAIQCAPHLYRGCRRREPEEINDSTKARYQILRNRWGS